jgi:hypothetical protein
MYDDESYTIFSELSHHFLREKKQTFSLNRFQQGKWILVGFATKRTKKSYTGVIVSVRENQE